MLKAWSIAKRILVSILPSVVAVGLAFGVGALLLITAGKNPGDAFLTLFMGALGSPNRIAETLVRAVPLMILALGISIAFKGQIWNIGGDGQFMMGATCAVFVGLNLNLPPLLLWPISFIAAFLGGGLWGGLAGVMRAKFNANEVITTLMLNYIAMHLLSWLIRGPMIDPNGQGFPQTALLAQSLHLPILFTETRLHLGLIIGLLIIIAGYFFWRTAVGFKTELVGESEQVARYCGIQVPRTIILTMFISAGLAGIAGWNEVFGVQYRLLDDISSGFGNLAIVVALLGNLHPLGIVISAFFFAALMVGGNTMQLIVGIPFSLVTVIQGLVIIFVISRVVYTQWRDRLAIRRFNSRIPDQSAGGCH